MLLKNQNQKNDGGNSFFFVFWAYKFIFDSQLRTASQKFRELRANHEFLRSISNPTFSLKIEFSVGCVDVNSLYFSEKDFVLPSVLHLLRELDVFLA